MKNRNKIIICIISCLLAIVYITITYFSNRPSVRSSPKIPTIQLQFIYETERSIIATPVADQHRLYVGSGDKHLHCLDTQIGQVLWKKNLSQTIEAPALLVANKILVGTTAGVFYCLTIDGEILWKYATESKILGSANYFTESQTGEFYILVGSYDNFLYCFRLKDGSIRWKYETGNYINGSPVVYQNKYAILGGCDQFLHIVHLQDGKVHAKIEIGSYIAASPSIVLANGQNQLSQDIAIVGTYGNSVLAISLEEVHSILWKYETESKESAFCSTPFIAGNYALLGSRNNRLYCLDVKDGTVVWEFSTQGAIDSSPKMWTQFQHAIIFGSEDGRIYGLNLYSGKKLWSYDVGSPIVSSPCIANKQMSIGARNGYIYIWTID